MESVCEYDYTYSISVNKLVQSKRRKLPTENESGVKGAGTS